jgi:PmbA protein
MGKYDRELEIVYNAAQRLGSAGVETLIKEQRTLTIKSFEGKLEDFSLSIYRGLGARVLEEGREGYAYTEDFAEDKIRRCVEEALENAVLIEREEPGMITDFPAPESDLDLFNPSLGDVPVQEKVQRALELEKATLGFDTRVKKAPYNAYAEADVFVRVANNRGLDRSFRENMITAYSQALAEEGEDRKSAFEIQNLRRFEDLDVRAIGRKAAEKAVSKLGAREIQSGAYPVLFLNEAMADLLDTFSSIFNAQQAQEGKSLLRGKLGDGVGADHLHIQDDALLPTGFATRPFDNEGYPSQCTDLLVGGVFKSFLHNSRTARKDGVASTGNASRRVKDTLRISPTNLFIVPGEATEEELLTRFPRVVRIVDMQGFHAGANPISGDFSLSAQGVLYENGAPVHPVHNFTVSGNFLQMLKDVELIGRDLRFNYSSIGAPSLLVRSLHLGGV